MRVLVACHDAGGAEIVSAWVRRHRSEHDVRCLLAGPARAIFAAKLDDIERVDELPPPAGFDLVLCGSSGEAELERRVVRAARAAGVRCAVWLDHWVAYRPRFELDGELVLPDEVWVADEHAARLAAATLPGADVRHAGNPYLEDATAEVRALAGDRLPGEGGERILYVTQPATAGAERETGDPLGWGYDERDALARWLGHAERSEPPPAAVRVRMHPAEPAGKYAAELAAHEARLPLSVSTTRSLAEDCAWADTVVGCDTMAMVVALHAGRRVVCAIPPGGRPLSLPLAGIERLN